MKKTRESYVHNNQTFKHWQSSTFISDYSQLSSLTFAIYYFFAPFYIKS